jgi:hypothetical protein
VIHLRGAGIVLNDELLSCMYVLYVCMYVSVEMLIPRTCFSIGVTTHLDMAGTTPPEIVCMYVCPTKTQGKAMFPEGGDADATAAYVSMYQECAKGW